MRHVDGPSGFTPFYEKPRRGAVLLSPVQHCLLQRGTGKRCFAGREQIFFRPVPVSYNVGRKKFPDVKKSFGCKKFLHRSLRAL
jgi:hypothetical protein